MDYGPPAPPHFGAAPQAANSYHDMAIAFGILFAVFFTLTCGLIFLLLCIALRRGGNGGGQHPRQYRVGPNNEYGT